MLRKARSLGQKLSTYIVVHRCDRFAPSRRHRKSGSLLNRLWSLSHAQRSQQRSNAICLEISTSEQYTATDLVNLLHLLRPVLPDHTV